MGWLYRAATQMLAVETITWLIRLKTSQPNRNRGERDRCLALRGKCFRCARSDHMIPQCSVLVAADFNHTALIGWQDLQKLHVIPASFPAVAAVAQGFKDIKTKTLDAFPCVFSDTLDNRPTSAQRMQIHMKKTVHHIGYRHLAPSHSVVFRSQPMPRSLNT